MKRIFLCLLFISLWASNARASITINAGGPGYNHLPSVQNVTIHSDASVRTAALSSLVGAYRTIHGLGSLPTGTVFKVVWGDGSSELAMTVALVGTITAEPIPDTQVEAPAGTGGGGGTGTGTGSTYGIIGYRAIYRTGTVCVDGGGCSYTTILIGYEPIYGWISVNSEP